MRNWMRLALGGLVGALVILLAGYLWGSAGKAALSDGRAALTLRLDLAEARGHLLAARVSLYGVNFGDASRQLEDAKAALARAVDDLRRQDGDVQEERLSKIIEAAADAQRLAGRVDQAANTRAADAVQELDRVIAELPLIPVLPE
jgi:hypothetical protein